MRWDLRGGRKFAGSKQIKWLWSQHLQPDYHRMVIRPTYACVDLAALEFNLKALSTSCGNTPICAVVKADAYGHGIVQCARAAQRAGACWLAVAMVEEGVLLRNAGIRLPILVMSCVAAGAYDTLVHHHLTPVVYRKEHLEGIAKALGPQQNIAIHLKINTGMNRLGVQVSDLKEFLQTLKMYPTLKLAGVMTHLANADLLDERQNTIQLDVFDAARQILKNSGYEKLIVHAANSAGALTHPRSQQMLLRLGLSLYGYDPSLQNTLKLKPVLSWKTKPIQIHQVGIGEAVSYGGHWRAKALSTVATLPVGYADGYLRALSRGASVLINGQRAPVIGSVCMDMIMVDVTGLGDISYQSEVVLLGSQSGERIDADELANTANTIAYEILCSISSRVPRVYVNEDGADV